MRAAKFPHPVERDTFAAMRYLTLMIFAMVSVAQAATVAVMPVEAPDRQADGRRLHDALRKALPTLGLTDKGDVRLNLPEARISFSCFEETPDCMAQVGQILEADELVWAKLEVKGPDVALTLNWLDVASAKLKRRETLVIPSGIEVGPVLEAAAPAFLSKQPMPSPAPAKSRITFISEPDGAEVWLDDARMGKTPTTIELVRGEYRLELRREGHQTMSQALDVSGPTRTMRFELVPSAAVGAGKGVEPAPGRSRWKLWAGSGALVGAIGLGVLAAGFSADGNDAVKQANALCSDFSTGMGGCTLRPEQKAEADTLREKRDSAQAKALVTGISAGILAGAGAWLIVDHFLSDDEPSVSVTPTIGGAAITGRF